jgi:putative endonuclease
MAIHHELGEKGEEMATGWLANKGYKILQRNWKCGSLEIDIIATRDDCLHFIEVKSRNSSTLGHPEDGVGKQKFRRLQNAAHVYLQMNPQHKWIQYDILAITLFRDREPEFFFLEDVFL